MATLYYRPYTSEPITEGELPPENAVESVLPEYNYIFPAPPSTRRAPHPHPAGISNSMIPKLHPIGADYVGHIDGQLGEIERYKEALRKMGQDILALREKVKELELQNSALRRDMGNYSDTSRLLQDSVELDGIPKPELISRYASLKSNLVSTTSELSRYKDKVHRLQNELIKKNNSEDRYMEVNSAHVSQQKILQQLQEKVTKLKKLEDTCMKQEKVIQRMERLLEEKQFNQQKRSLTQGKGEDDESLSKALLEENRRLRDEMEKYKNEGAHASGMEESERLELYQLLDKAETRIASLEKQVSKTARKQRSEKDALLRDLGKVERAYLDQQRDVYRDIEGVERAYKRHQRDTHRDHSHHHHHHPERRSHRAPAPVVPNIQFYAVPVPVNADDLRYGRYSRSPRRYDDGYL